MFESIIEVAPMNSQLPFAAFGLSNSHSSPFGGTFSTGLSIDLTEPSERNLEILGFLNSLFDDFEQGSLDGSHSE